MKKCKQLLEGVSAICGKVICCSDCDSKCENKCDKTPDTCGFAIDEEINKNISEPTSIAKMDEFMISQKETLSKIRDFEIEALKIETEKKVLKEKLKEAMEKFNIKKFENDYLTITYIAPTKRESFDSKKLKVEKPDIYNEYKRTSNISASIRIEVR